MVVPQQQTQGVIMDEMVKGIVDFLSDNPSFFTLVLGFVLGYFVAKR